MNLLHTTRKALAATLLIAATAAGLGAHAHASPAYSPTAIFANPSHAYTLSYPATWIKTNPQGADVVILAPDHNVMVGTFTAPLDGRTLAPGAAGRAIRGFAHGAGYTMMGVPMTGTLRLHGVPASYASVAMRDSTGRQSFVLVVETAGHGQAILVVGMVPNTAAPTYSQDNTEMMQVTTSLTLR